MDDTDMPAAAIAAPQIEVAEPRRNPRNNSGDETDTHELDISQRVELAAQKADAQQKHAFLEGEALKTWTKWRKETIAPCNWDVDRIIKGTTECRDVTDLVMGIIEARGITKRDTLRRFKYAMAHCINVKASRTEGNLREYKCLPSLQTLSTGPTMEYDYKILQAASFFRVSCISLNKILCDVEDKLQQEKNEARRRAEAAMEEEEDQEDEEIDVVNDQADKENERDKRVTIKTDVVEAAHGSDVSADIVMSDRSELSEEDSEKEAERKIIEEGVRIVKEEEEAKEQRRKEEEEAKEKRKKERLAKEDEEWRKNLPKYDQDGKLAFSGDMLDETKGRYERYRSFVDQIFYHVDDDYEKECLEWMVKCMVDPKNYNDVPSVYMKDKVLEYFKVMLPSLIASPFEIEKVRFADFVTTERKITIKTKNYGFESESDEEQLMSIHRKIMDNREAQKKMAKEEKERKKKEATQNRKDEQKRRKEMLGYSTEESDPDQSQGEYDSQDDDDESNGGGDTSQESQGEDEEEGGDGGLNSSVHHEETVETETTTSSSGNPPADELFGDTSMGGDSSTFGGEETSSSSRDAANVFAQTMEPRREESKEGCLERLKTRDPMIAGKKGIMKKVKEEVKAEPMDDGYEALSPSDRHSSPTRQMLPPQEGDVPTPGKKERSDRHQSYTFSDADEDDGQHSQDNPAVARSTSAVCRSLANFSMDDEKSTSERKAKKKVTLPKFVFSPPKEPSDDDANDEEEEEEEEEDEEEEEEEEVEDPIPPSRRSSRGGSPRVLPKRKNADDLVMEAASSGTTMAARRSLVDRLQPPTVIQHISPYVTMNRDESASGTDDSSAMLKNLRRRSKVTSANVSMETEDEEEPPATSTARAKSPRRVSFKGTPEVKLFEETPEVAGGDKSTRVQKKVTAKKVSEGAVELPVSTSPKGSPRGHKKKTIKKEPEEDEEYLPSSTEGSSPKTPEKEKEKKAPAATTTKRKSSAGMLEEERRKSPRAAKAPSRYQSGKY